MAKTAVLVLGMHRSGTSVLTQVISKMGFHLGAGQLGASEHNVEGHFERKDVIALDDAILRTFGMEWFSFGERVPEMAGVEPRFLKEANRILDGLFGESDAVVIKEPRMCITLPLWEKVLEARGVSVKYVFAFRHPKSVALSLKRRNKISIENGQALWLYYNHALLSKIDKDIFAVNYDEMVNSPTAVLDELAMYLGKDSTDAGNVIKNTMRHHVTPFEFSDNENVVGEYYKGLLEGFSRVVGPSEIKGFLSKHKYVGEYLKKMTPLKWHTQVFFNQHKEYTEKDSVQTVISGGQNELTFDLTEYKKLYSLRFDPHMDSCRLRLDDVRIWDTHNKEVKYKIETNAETVDGNTYLFKTIDPQVAFLFKPKKLSAIRLSFEID
ncbi:MAG: hypothetical protein AB1Z19_02390 [Eubacteriales bacterium]